MKRLLIVLVIVGSLGALFVFGLTRRNLRDISSPRLEKTMLDFEGNTFQRYQGQYGETLRYSDYADSGIPIVVNFWASWCVPCWNETARLEAAWRKYRGKISMIGVNFQDETPDALNFIDRFQLTFPSVKDPRGSIGIDWGVFGLPETFFIRADGTLNYKHTGEITTDILEEQIRALLE